MINTKITLLAIGLGVNFFVLVPIIFIFIIRYIGHMSDPFIRARKPRIVVVYLLVLLVIGSFIMLTLWFSTIMWTNKWLFLCRDFFASAVFQFLLQSAVYRVWMVFYSYKLQADMVRSLITDQLGWFQKHIQTFGNPRFVVPILIVLGGQRVCVQSLDDLLKGGFPWVGKLVSFLISDLLFPIPLSILVPYHISQLDDVMLIRPEFKGILIVYSLASVVVALIYIVPLFKITQVEMETFVEGMIAIVFGIMLGYIQTEYVLSLQKQFTGRENNLSRSQSITILTKEFCSNIHGYLSFLDYLTKEYSSENLFYVSEVVHFVRSFLPYLPEDEVVRNVMKLWEMPQRLPKSDIMKLKSDWKARFMAIVELYVFEDSHRAVNISYGHREAITDVARERFALETKRSVNSFLSRGLSLLPRMLSNKSWFSSGSRQSGSLNMPLLEEDSERERNDLMKEISVSEKEISESESWSNRVRNAVTSFLAMRSLSDSSVEKTVIEEDEVETLIECMEVLIEAALDVQALLRGSYTGFQATEAYLTFADARSRTMS